jgi:hypothetical protein
MGYTAIKHVIITTKLNRGNMKAYYHKGENGGNIAFYCNKMWL